MSLTLSRSIEKGWAGRQTNRSKREPEKYESASRCWNMYKEALEFRDSLAQMEEAMAVFNLATYDFMHQCIPLLRVPLPRVWDAVEGGLAEPIRATVSHTFGHMAGGDHDLDSLRAVETDLEKRVKWDVTEPVGQWIKALNTVKERMPDLEQLRTAAATQLVEIEAAAKQQEEEGRAGVQSPPSRSKAKKSLFACTSPKVDEGDDGEGAHFKEEDRNIKNVAMVRRHEATMANFNEQEGLVGEQLSGLCRDAAWTKSYLASSLVITKEALQSGVSALGPTKQPLPSFGLERVTSNACYGDVTTNMDLLSEMPQFLEEGGRLRPGAPTVAARMQNKAHEQLRAHKATASPMELHARADAKPGDVVPPVGPHRGGYSSRTPPSRRAAARSPFTGGSLPEVGGEYTDSPGASIQPRSMGFQ